MNKPNWNYIEATKTRVTHSLLVECVDHLYDYLLHLHSSNLPDTSQTEARLDYIKATIADLCEETGIVDICKQTELAELQNYNDYCKTNNITTSK